MGTETDCAKSNFNLEFISGRRGAGEASPTETSSGGRVKLADARERSDENKPAL